MNVRSENKPEKPQKPFYQQRLARLQLQAGSAPRFRLPLSDPEPPLRMGPAWPSPANRWSPPKDQNPRAPVPEALPRRLQGLPRLVPRSEERRVGKECKSRTRRVYETEEETT